MEDVNAAGKVRKSAIKRKDRDGNEFREYVQPNGEDVPSVTTFLKVLPKGSALEKWQKGQLVRFMLNPDNYNFYVNAPGQDEDTKVKMILESQYQNKGAARSGDMAHAIMESLARDEEPYVPEGFEPLIKWWQEFVEQFDPEPIAVEPLIHNYKRHYSGSTDWLGYTTYKGERKVTILDWKSGKGLYGSTAYQNQAYAMGDTYIDDNDVEQDMPVVERSLGGWIRPAGWALIPLEMNEDTENVVKAARALYGRIEQDWHYKKKAINKSPLNGKTPGPGWPNVEED